MAQVTLEQNLAIFCKLLRYQLLWMNELSCAQVQTVEQPAKKACVLLRASQVQFVRTRL